MKVINGMKKQTLLILFIVIIAALLTGCAEANDDQAPSAFLTGGTLDEQAPGSNSIFTVKVQKDGDPVGVDFRGTVSSGAVSIRLVSTSGKVVWQETSGTGPFNMNLVITPPAGEYQLGLAWEGSAKATYDLYWRPGKIMPPTITPLAALQGVGMLLVTAGFVVYAGIRKLGWRALLLGALFWVLTVLLKFVWAGALNSAIYAGLTGVLPGVAGSLIFDVYVGSLTGIFEVGLTYLILRRTRLARSPWKTAFAFGIGFGAVEALLLSISPLISAILGMTNPSTLSLSTLQNIAMLNNPLWGLTGVWERFFTVWIHIACNVLIFYTLITGQKKWFWLSFGIKTVLDSVAAYIQVNRLNTNLGAIWIVEFIIAAIGAACWWLTNRLSHEYPDLSGAAQPEPAPVE
jgi:uncharacterized membrane protein YhfC